MPAILMKNLMNFNKEASKIFSGNRMVQKKFVLEIITFHMKPSKIPFCTMLPIFNQSICIKSKIKIKNKNNNGHKVIALKNNLYGK